MSERHREGGGLPAAIRRFEHATGLYRPGRSPWVWIGPGINVAGSIVMVTWVGVEYGLGWAATIPTALVLSLFMGAMSAAFLANWEDEAEEDERRAAGELADPPPPPGGPGAVVPVPPEPPTLPAEAVIGPAVEIPVPAAEREASEPVPVGR